MASQQKRLLSQANSKLGKGDLGAMLRNEDSWALLPGETREHLYTLLPAPKAGEDPHDLDVHPLNTRYRAYIEEELRRFQDDLKDGRETKKWRMQALEASKERLDGRYDEWKEKAREDFWGRKDENAPPNDEDRKVAEKLEIKDSEAGERSPSL